MPKKGMQPRASHRCVGCAKCGQPWHQHSARCHIHEVHAVARAASHDLVGIAVIGGLEPTVDAQTGARTLISGDRHRSTMTQIGGLR